jgi:hypothetical protein
VVVKSLPATAVRFAVAKLTDPGPAVGAPSGVVTRSETAFEPAPSPTVVVAGVNETVVAPVSTIR